MAAETTTPVNRVALQVTQSAFVVRLFAIAAALLASFGRAVDVAALVGCVIAGVTSYIGLTRPDLLRQVTRHPSIALADVLLIAAATAIGGPISPFVLAVLTTALLLGLWIDLLAGVIVIVSLLGLYTLGLIERGLSVDDILLSVVVIPFVYLMLWYLGLTLRRALRQQDESQRVLRDAIATAAASEERANVSRQLHDSVAKSLQGIVLSASSLPVYVQRDPARASAVAADIQQMSGVAVHELRQLMGSLRGRTSEQPLGQAAHLVVAQWQARTGRVAHVDVSPTIDTRDEAVRYELLVVLQEALENVHRHAGPAEVRIGLAERGEDFVLTVADDGRGADPLAVEAAARAGHFGVKGLHERMARVGGRAEWHSALGQGTTVTCTVHGEGLLER